MSLTKRFASPIIAAALVGLGSTAANAAVVINVTEIGGNVVFSALGSLDLTGAPLLSSGSGYGQGFISGGSNWYVAPGPGSSWDSYAFTTFDGPFGTNAGFVTPPDSFSGDDFFIWGNGGGTPQVGVAAGYASGAAISSGMVFAGTTIAGLSMTAGTYTYRIPNDFVTLNIGGGGTVPEPASLALVSIALAGLGLGSRRRRGAKG